MSGPEGRGGPEERPGRGPEAPGPGPTSGGGGAAGAGPLRVLHVDSAREWRGGQNQVRLLVRRLRDEPGVRQALAGCRGSRLLAEARDVGVEAIPLSWDAGLDPRAVAALLAPVRGADVVHAHTSHALQTVVVSLALGGAPAGLVATRRTSGGLRSAAVWRRAELVLAVSDAAAGRLAAGGLEPARIRVVPSGVALPEAGAASEGALRRAAGAGEGRALVGSVGALEPEKGHDVFLRAAARLAEGRPDLRFVVAGEGSRREELETLAAELGLTDRLALPGHVPDAARSLGDLDVFVLASRQEGLGSAALEALAAGVPAVLSRAGGLPQVAGREVPTVPPGDPAALAAAVGRLLDEPGRRERVAAVGRRRVRERFTAGRMAAATLEAYRAVAGTRRRRREHARWMERVGALRRARPVARGARPAGSGEAP